MLNDQRITNVLGYAHVCIKIIEFMHTCAIQVYGKQMLFVKGIFLRSPHIIVTLQIYSLLGPLGATEEGVAARSLKETNEDGRLM